MSTRRALMDANGLWYVADEDDTGTHHQGVGRYDTAQEALDADANPYHWDEELGEEVDEWGRSRPRDE